MKVIDDLNKETINMHGKNISGNDNTDNSNLYVPLKNYIPKHNLQVILKEKVRDVMLWVQVCISKAKRALLNSYNNIKLAFLQGSFDRVCSKFIRIYIIKPIIFRRFLGNLQNNI